MSQNRKIEPVHDNNDKAQTFRTLMPKHKKAMKIECYFEAMLIDYALLEDRLRSYLYYLGIFKNRDSYKFDNKKIKPYIKNIVDNYSDTKGNKLIVSNISGKIRIVYAVHAWYKDGCPNPDNSVYLNELAECIDVCTDSSETIKVLDEICEWCKYRNEVVHAVLNKNLESLNTDISEKALRGMELGRMLDNQIKVIKKRNNIRKTLKLSLNT